MAKLVVGQFSESFPPLMDGVGLVVKNYTELLLEKGHEVYAVVSGDRVAKGYKFDEAAAINYTIRADMYPVPGVKPYGIVIKNKNLRSQINQINFDIIHSHNPFVLGRYAEKVAKKANVPLVATFHSLYRDDFYKVVHSENISDILLKSIMGHFEKADEVWTPSLWSKNKLYEYGFEGEVQIIPNGCDFLIPDEEEYRQYQARGREVAGVSQERPLLLYVGQINEKKNLNLILKALLAVSQKGLDFKMVFVGDGADMPKFKTFVRANNLDKKISFLGRISDRETIKSLMAAASLFPFPSQYDVAPLVMREAAAFRLPLLSTKGSTTAFSTQHEYNGFIVDNDLAHYTSELVRLIGNRNHCDEVGITAQKTLYLHWKDVIDAVIQRYEELIAKKQLYK